MKSRKNRREKYGDISNRFGATGRRGHRQIQLNIIACCAWLMLIVGAICLISFFTNERNSARKNERLRSMYYSLAAPTDTEGQTLEFGSENHEKTVSDSPSVSLTGDIGVETAISVAMSRHQPTESNSLRISQEENMPEVEDLLLDVPLDVRKDVQPQFDELYGRNHDLVMWLEVGEGIAEPVLYRDNDYYMTRDFDGAYSIEGSIFLDECNHANLSDDVVLIYGHNMRNGHKFGNLDLFRDLSYLNQYRTFSVHSIWGETPENYVIFSVFDASMNETDSSYIDIRQFNFETDANKQSYIDEIVRRSLFETQIEVDVQDQLVVLVTCSYTHDNGRLLIVGRRLRNGETVDEVPLALSKY